MKFAFKISVQLGLCLALVHVVNTPVLGTMFQFVRRTPSKTEHGTCRTFNLSELD